MSEVKKFKYSPSTTFNPQTTANGISIQGNTQAVQGSSPQLQVSNSVGGRLQPAVSPMKVGGGAPGQVLGLTTSNVPQGGGGVDPATAAANAKAAEDARMAGVLRGDITNLANLVKGIFNQRYGQVDAAAAEQTGKLNERFTTEAGDITTQTEGENQKLGAAHASGGTFDSSYRSNNQDTVTNAGKAQINELGIELKDNVGKVGQFVAGKKNSFDAEKGAMDTLVSRIAESTDPNELRGIRNSLDAKIAGLKGEAADNNTTAQNISALQTIAPSNQRAQKLKVTLSSIVAGNADKGSKTAIAQKLIQSAGLSDEEQAELFSAFQSDISKKEQPAA